MKLLLFLLLNVSFVACSYQDNSRRSSQSTKSTEPLQEQGFSVSKEGERISSEKEYKKIHSFYNEGDSLIGYMFVHLVKESIYDSLVITNSSGNFDRYLYQIKWNQLSNKSGVDLVGSPDFFWL